MKKINLLVLVLVIIVSCKKSKDSDNTPSKNYPFYFTGDVNGVSLKWQGDDETDSKYQCNISQAVRQNGVSDFDIYEGTVIMDKETIPSNLITVSLLKYFNHSPNAAERIAMIAPGVYPYGVSNSSSATVNGVSIQYTDANGNVWNSELGVNTGSAFTITEVAESTDGLSDKIFKATFSCKVYNSTGSITFNNATIRGRVLAP